MAGVRRRPAPGRLPPAKCRHRNAGTSPPAAKAIDGAGNEGIGTAARSLHLPADCMMELGDHGASESARLRPHHARRPVCSYRGDRGAPEAEVLELHPAAVRAAGREGATCRRSRCIAGRAAAGWRSPRAWCTSDEGRSAPIALRAGRDRTGRAQRQSPSGTAFFKTAGMCG